MADHSGQNFSNHAKWVPGFHYFVLPTFLINALYAIYSVVGIWTFDAVLNAIVGVALFFTAVFGRVFALGAQDRVIRLEMRLRMKELLPDDLQGRINEFSPQQMVGLRFASDAELPDLARKVLDEQITAATPIKKEIKDWQGDYYRV
tara:strand:+ start:513 stop:953 length:441 start_codon:yes stop_codon:yes gene_type:complete